MADNPNPYKLLPPPPSYAKAPRGGGGLPPYLGDDGTPEETPVFDAIFNVIAVTLIVTAAIGALTLLFSPVYWMSRTECVQKAEAMEVEHDYGIIKGCLYEIDGQWTPDEMVRDFK